MKANPFLRYMIRPIIGKNLWQDQASFLFYFLSLIVMGYLAFLILTSPFYFQKLGAQQDGQEITGLRDLPELQPLAAYQQVVDAHPIFGAAKQEAIVSKNPCDGFIQSFSLSGIVQGGENEAIFLNKRTRQTHFASAGDNLEGVAIKAIHGHSVIVSCAEEEREILIEEA